MSREVKDWLERLTDIWPVLAALFGLIVLGAQADAQIGENKTRIEKIEQLDLPLHIARIEQSQSDIKDQLNKIERKQDAR